MKSPGATSSIESIVNEIPIAEVNAKKSFILYDITLEPESGGVLRYRDGSVAIENDKIIVTLKKVSTLADEALAYFTWQLIEGK